MRRVNLFDSLNSIPAGAHVEFVHEAKNADSANDQFAPASLFATSAANAATQAALDAEIAGGLSPAVSATSDGLTTGLISPTASFVTVAVDTDADDILTLPAAVAGKTIRILALVACELSSDVSGDMINNVLVDGALEALLVAGTLYTLVYDGIDNWVMSGLDTVGAVETPRIPD